MSNVGEFVDVVARGIPATARIDTLVCVKPWKGSPMTCPSSDDYYGYTELEVTICDSKGREAPWISDKMNSAEFESVDEQVLEYLGRVDE